MYTLVIHSLIMMLWLFSGELQDIRDVLQYTSHCDPQLKGNTAVLIGNVIHAGLIESRGRFDAWVKNIMGSGKKCIDF